MVVLLKTLSYFVLKENHEIYNQNNVRATQNLLRLLKGEPHGRLYLASSSAVYDNQLPVPFSEDEIGEQPKSYYGHTKRIVESLVHDFSSNTHWDVTIFRPFTVYGSWGRPDMALFNFVESIIEKQEIRVHLNSSQEPLQRDFTYIDDLIEAIYRLFIISPESEDNGTKIFNMGSSNPYSITHFIKCIEGTINLKAKLKLVPAHFEEMNKTYANTEKLAEAINYSLETDLKDGLQKAVQWHLKYYRGSENQKPSQFSAD